MSILLNTFQSLRRNRNNFSHKSHCSVGVIDNNIIDEFIADANNTFLVSFPRTGSHWLRMLMELYFEKPSLVRIFYFPKKKDYLTLHTHDMDLALKRKNVIYLYRDPVDTVFSQLKYNRDSLDDRERVKFWTRKYINHLKKWLVEENFTEKKTLVNYDHLKSKLESEFSKITAHFEQVLDIRRIYAIAEKVTKSEVNAKTIHDPRVVRMERDYELLRKYFKEKYSDYVWSNVRLNKMIFAEFFDDVLRPYSN